MHEIWNKGQHVIPASLNVRASNADSWKLAICTVIGSLWTAIAQLQLKFSETKDAIQNGASEIDMVINIGDVWKMDASMLEDEIAKSMKLVVVISKSDYQ